MKPGYVICLRYVTDGLHTNASLWYFLPTSCTVGFSLCLVRRADRFGHLEEHQQAILQRRQPR